MTIDWQVTVQAFALLGYEFKLPQGFEHLSLEEQLRIWGVFLESYVRCERECAWKGGGPCIHSECPRRLLGRVSLSALPLAPIRLEIK